jgi:hypothetical protein
MLVTIGALVSTMCVLAGCSTISSINPVNWWHRQEGGKIAEQRPAPPGADQPYPNIATVPAKPAPPDQDALNKLTASLVADRTNAQHAAQSAPLADPSSPTASPGLFGVGTAPPPPPNVGLKAGASGGGAAGTPVASASMPAVSAPASPPSPAPRKPVQSEPLEAPAGGSAASSGAASEPVAPGAAPVADAGSAASGPLPALPAGPPPRPSGAGASQVMPVALTPMPGPSGGSSVGPSGGPPGGPTATIVFLERESNLSQPASAEIKAFAVKRGNGTISVTGYGDSTSSDPDSQSAALTLGLSRAQSIVDALKADGVPGTAIRVSAEASGRGAMLQLLQ